MAWLILIVAGLFEIGWAIGLKYSDGFTKPIASIWTIAAMVISMTLLGIALRTLPVGTAYGVWVGIGTVGTVAFGIALFGEPASFSRLFFVMLIIVGIMGLKFTTQSNPDAVRDNVELRRSNNSSQE
ncbi:DMT family transporter [Mariniblastus fucicola]|uniref:Guanidinium exporter n=1 Tax=Mariniblastus fucicola TaxID=980251 RepID=A0A5B9PI70_9BACT|nr:quaternary ammonium compound efflux SMR transporter SugE [Mariniblastus fucicola]QEG24372.1 Quaternary ammonium compound-resistance protein SugE [Mariniblastus fucicola]